MVVIMFLYSFLGLLFPLDFYNTKHSLRGGKKLQRLFFFPCLLMESDSSWFNTCISDSGLLILHLFFQNFLLFSIPPSPQSVPTRESGEDINNCIGETSVPAEETNE